MARCTPDELPSWVLQDDRRSAEIRVFEKITKELSDEWHAFYSRPWWGLNKSGGEKDGEADFVLVHAELGILVLEIKGGQISYDESKDQWASTDRYGIKHNFKRSPVQQAVSSKHQLLRKFALSNKWPTGRVLAHHGVIFVDTIDSGLKLLGGYEKEIFCFSRNFENHFSSWIIERLTSHREPREIGPGKFGIEAIYEALATPLKLRTTLSRSSDGDINEMNQLLTGVQLQSIAEIEEHKRTIVEGGAGTGKTIIACELALRIAEKNKVVGLCTISESLLTDLQSKTSSSKENLKVMSINQLVSSEMQFDFIIVDESQDVNWGDWEKIEQKLAGLNSQLVCFMDSNQAIYRLATDLEIRLAAKRITLRLNLRNTKSIAEVINKFYRGPATQICGPLGTIPVLSIVHDTESAIEDVILEVQKFNAIESVDYSAIAILSDSSDFLRRMTKALNTAGIFSASASRRRSNCLVLDSIYNFKGLEAPFVFVFMDSESGNHRELSYVAASRARTYLRVFATNENLLVCRAFSSSH